MNSGIGTLTGHPALIRRMAAKGVRLSRLMPRILGCFVIDRVRDAAVQGAVLRIFLRAVEHCLRAHSPGCSAAARLGAVAFIHRFGSSLNARLHFHCIVIDGVFDSAAACMLPLLRRADADGCSREISAATANGWRWPAADCHRSRLSLL
jgi:Putative transposase